MEQNIDKAFIITQNVKRPKTSKKQPKIEQLYEQVIQKNFQTINDLLKKLTSIISRHDQLQTEVLTFTKRLTKFETDLESIHNEHRRNNLHIFSNITGIRTQIVGIDTHLKYLFDEVKQKNSMPHYLQHTLRQQKKQSISNGSRSLMSSTHKLSENDSCVNLRIQQQFEAISKQPHYMKRGSQNLQRSSVSNYYLANIHKQDNILNESTKTFKHSNFLQAKNVVDDGSVKFIRQFQFQQKTLHQTNNQKQKQQRQVQLQKQKLATVLEKSTKINNFSISLNLPEQNKIVEEANRQANKSSKIYLAKQEKQEIAASIAKHKTRISSIFKQIRENQKRSSHILDEQSIKDKFIHAIDQLIAEDQEINIKISANGESARASKQICELMYLELLNDEIEQKSNNQKLFEYNKVEEIINSKLEKLKNEFLELQKKIEVVEKDNESRLIKHIEVEKKLETLELEINLQSTKQKIEQQALKCIEKSLKKWDQHHIMFANKVETKKAIEYLGQKMSLIIKTLDIKTLQEDEQQSQGRCLCCTRSLGKNSTKIDLSTISRTPRNSVQATTKRIMQHKQLKKRTLQVLRVNKTRKQISKSEYKQL